MNPFEDPRYGKEFPESNPASREINTREKIIEEMRDDQKILDFNREAIICIMDQVGVDTNELSLIENGQYTIIYKGIKMVMNDKPSQKLMSVYIYPNADDVSDRITLDIEYDVTEDKTNLENKLFLYLPEIQERVRMHFGSQKMAA